MLFYIKQSTLSWCPADRPALLIAGNNAAFSERNPFLLLIKHSSLLLFSLSLRQITAFDELQADFKVPIDQGNPLHAVGVFSYSKSLSPNVSPDN